MRNRWNNWWGHLWIDQIYIYIYIYIYHSIINIKRDMSISGVQTEAYFWKSNLSTLIGVLFEINCNIQCIYTYIYIYIYIYIQKLMIWRKAIFPNHVMKINILIVCFQSGTTLLQMLRSWIGQMRSRDHEHSFEKIFANSDTIIIIDSVVDLDSFSSVSCSLFFSRISCRSLNDHLEKYLYR